MDYVRTGNFSLSNIGFFRQQEQRRVELATNLREDFIITEKAPTNAFSFLKAPN